MTLFPIVGRELRVLSRNWATYWTRATVALVGLLICLEVMVSAQAVAPSKAGTYAFNLLLGAAFVVSCTGCFLAADAISSERRQGTLELLFLTTVKPVDVVLGKLGSVGFNGVCSLAAFLPVLMLPVLGGGVTGGEAFRKGLVLMNTLFLALVAGLCASAGHEERSRALRQAIAFIVLLSIVPYLIYASSSRSIPHYAGLVSPLSALSAAGDLRYLASPHSFWVSLAFGQTLAWLLLVGAAFRLHRGLNATSEDPAVRMARLRAEAERAIGLGSWEPVKNQSTPVEWLVHRRYGVGGVIWGAGMLALAYSGWVSLAHVPIGNRTAFVPWLFAWPLGVAGGLIGGTMVAWVSSRFFVGVRRTGDLELLMTTPLGADSIISDQWAVLKRFFVWPVLVLQAPMLPQLIGLLTAQASRVPPDISSQIVLLKLFDLANAFLGAAALCWLAMWFGLKARSQGAAIVWAVGLAKGIPFLISLVCLVLGSAFLGPWSGTAPSVGGSHLGAYAFITWLPGASTLLLYLWLIKTARQGLESDLKGTQGPRMEFNFRTLVWDSTQILRAG